jgi:hypothetical protein
MIMAVETEEAAIIESMTDHTTRTTTDHVEDMTAAIQEVVEDVTAVEADRLRGTIGTDVGTEEITMTPAPMEAATDTEVRLVIALMTEETLIGATARQIVVKETKEETTDQVETSRETKDLRVVNEHAAGRNAYCGGLFRLQSS